MKSNLAAWLAPGPRVSRAELRAIDKEYDKLRSALGDGRRTIMDDPTPPTTPPGALEVARVLEPYDLLFFEEPTIPEDPEAYARVRHITEPRSPVPSG